MPKKFRFCGRVHLRGTLLVNWGEKIEIEGVKRVSNVTQPTITYFLSDSAKATGTTVMVCPGGAYQILAIEHEGVDVCKWLNEIGVHAVLLKYRVPRRKNREPHSAPLQDAQRAMGLIREAVKILGGAPDQTWSSWVLCRGKPRSDDCDIL